MLTKREDALQMPARWWSIQWLSMRVLYGLIVAGVLTRNVDPGPTFLIGGLVVAVVVFVVLTVLAHLERRRWARAHDL